MGAGGMSWISEGTGCFNWMFLMLIVLLTIPREHGVSAKPVGAVFDENFP